MCLSFNFIAGYSNDTLYQYLRENVNKSIKYLAQHYKQDFEKFFLAMDKLYFNGKYSTSSKEQVSKSFLNL